MAFVDDYDYALPEAAIAQEPIEPRSASRLLVAVGSDDPVEHRRVADLPSLVGPGDVVVVNDTRVIPARLCLEKATGGSVEVFLLERIGDRRWDALVRPARRVPPSTILFAGGEAVVAVEAAAPDGHRVVRIVAGDDDDEVLARFGAVPLPPYIARPLADPERYQTVYATHPGSVAAPTAGLHLTDELLDGVRAAGATIATVELTVGIDTFRPMTASRVDDHEMHSERYTVPPETLDACAHAARVVAVGTTTVRALESAAVGPAEGRTSLFIKPGFRFRVVDVMLTNFHLPRSSLLVLLAAFTGARWRGLYDEALRSGYRFLSFGDAMLVGRGDE